MQYIQEARLGRSAEKSFKEFPIVRGKLLEKDILNFSYCISVIKGSSPLTGPYCIWPHKKRKRVRVLPKYYAHIIWKKLAR